MRKLTGAAKIKHEQRLKRLRALMGEEESVAEEKDIKATATSKPKSNPDPQPQPESKPQPKRGFRLFDPEELEQWWNM